MKRRIHKVGSFAIIFCLMFTTLVSAATVSFTDISNSWAKDYIIKAAELGFIKGDVSGTFRPKDKVTMVESIAMLSRLYELDDELEKQIENKYIDVIKEITNGKDTWFYTDLAKALELNIISEDSLRTLYENGRNKAETSREQSSIFLTNVLFLNEEVNKIKNTIYELPFLDTNTISSQARPYIYVMFNKKILGGDDNKNFNPKDPVTREQFATMVCNAYDYIKANNVAPKFDDYATYKTIKGTIQKITINPVESYLEIIPDNETKAIMIRMLEGTTTVKIDKTISKISKLEKGMVVECKVDTKTTLANQITVDTSTKLLEGKIKKVYFSPPMKLIITDKNNVERTYSIDDSITITLNNKITEFKNLKANDLVTVKLVGDVITRVDSISRIQTFNGKIKDVKYEFPIKLLVEDEAGKVHTFIYDEEPYVTRNTISTTFDQLRVGDNVLVRTEYDILTAIDATSMETPVDSIATIKEIRIGATNSIKIQTSDDEIKEYKLSNSAKISVLNSSSTIYDLRVGYKVNVAFSGSEIISIDAVETETSQKIMGKIVYVNLDKKLIMLQIPNGSNENETVYLSLSNNSVIMTLSAQKLSVSDLKIGDSVICVGSYSGGTFNAVSVIVE